MPTNREIVLAKHPKAESQKQDTGMFGPEEWSIYHAHELGTAELGTAATEELAWAEAARRIMKAADGASTCGVLCPVCGNPCIRDNGHRPGHFCGGAGSHHY